MGRAKVGGATRTRRGYEGVDEDFFDDDDDEFDREASQRYGDVAPVRVVRMSKTKGSRGGNERGVGRDW